MKTEASKLFDEFNRRYWRGRLPRYRVIQRRLEGDLGQCLNKSRTIFLQRGLSDQDLRLTLLHEMCHIGTGRGYDHGPTFMRKVHRLIRLGESKLIEDVKRYERTSLKREIAEMRARGVTVGKLHIEERKSKGIPLVSILFRQAVESDLEDLAQANCQYRWSSILPTLAKQHKMTPSQFRRAAPWAERKWREIAAFECAFLDREGGQYQ